jgi:hypothetical protein
MAEEIGGVYNTKIPEYSDNADIQEAFKLFLYGSTTIPANPASIVSPSIAAHLKDLRDDVDDISDIGIGSSYAATEPTSVTNGYIWVDADAVIASSVLVPTALYQNSEPTGTIAEGTLWVDKNSSPLKMYVYDTALGWREVGA